MRETPSNSSGNFPNLENIQLIDDGEWHSVTIDARERQQEWL